MIIIPQTQTIWYFFGGCHWCAPGAMYVFDRRRAVRGHDLVGAKVGCRHHQTSPMVVEPPVGTTWRQCSRCMLRLSCTSHLGFDWKADQRYQSPHVACFFGEVSVELPGRCTRASGSAELARCQFSFAWDVKARTESCGCSEKRCFWECANTHPFPLSNHLDRMSRQEYHWSSINTGESKEGRCEINTVILWW